MKTKQQLARDTAHVNQLLKDEGRRLLLGTKRSKARLETARLADDNTTYSYWARLEFLEYCRRQLEGHAVLPASVLIAEGARIIGLSLITTKRYMSELKAGATAPLLGFGDNIMLNHGYVPPDEDPYWQAIEQETEE